MSEILKSYRKIVKLPADDLHQARPIRTLLDDQVQRAVTALTTQEPALQVTRTSDEGGNCSLLASANGYDIQITTRSGQDSQFQGGQRRTFISYTLSASSSLRMLDRAASISREAAFILRGVGAVVFAGLLVGALDLVFRNSGIIFIRLPTMLVIAIILAGAWIGERIGYFIGNRLEAHAYARAEKTGALPQLDRLWADLEKRFNALLNSYERA